MRNFLRKILSDRDVAVDLGTAFTRVYKSGKGMIFEEPTPVPMNRGVVKDVDKAPRMLASALRLKKYWGYSPSRAIVSYPVDLTNSQRETLVGVIKSLGPSTVAAVPAPLAAAVGAGMDISREEAQLVVDIGDGLTEMALIKSGNVAWFDTLKRGCCDFRQEPLNPVLQEICLFIKDRIMAMPEEDGVSVIDSGFFVTGGGSCLKGLSQNLSHLTGLQVKVPSDSLHAVITGAGRILEYADQSQFWDHSSPN